MTYFDLPDACQLLQLPREEVLSLVERGILQGRQHPDGSWVVGRESVIAYSHKARPRCECVDCRQARLVMMEGHFGK